MEGIFFMTSQEEKYFELLSEKRKNFSKELEDEDYRGIKNVIVEKYSDQAHFIYELLQNADDTGASRAEFILSKDKLIFKHNGKEKFTVSNPYAKGGTHGHINAITSIGNSNKDNKIGKFGIGFKAGFQYTDTPAIFESHVAFRIKNFIVPERLTNRDIGNETVFEFPFDKEDCPPFKAFSEISEKLRGLKYPILFLTNLQEVKFDIAGKIGGYKKEIQSAREFKDMTAELLKLIDGKAEEKFLWLFSRKFDDKNYSVGYFLENGRLKPVEETAFCFFPTKRETKLKFIIHAPFLLTSSREGIKASELHNENMIKLLSDFAADSLIYLRDFGLIDDGILEIIPLKETDFDVASDEISFKPFFKAIKNKMQTEKILPTRDGCVAKENAYWADTARIIETFSDRQLGEFVGNPSAAWVFTTIGERNAGSVLKSYLKDITEEFIDGNDLIKFIDRKFIEAQPLEWFHTFYKWISETSGRSRIANKRPFFLDENFHAVAAFDENFEPILFLSNDNAPDLAKIHPDLLKNPDTEKFLKEIIGLREPTIEDEIYNRLETKDIKIISGSFIEAQTIDWLHRFYKWLSERTDRIEIARKRPFFLDENCEATAAFYKGKPILFLPNDGGYRTIHPDLLKNPYTKKFLLNNIGLKVPSLKDEINEKIRPQYESDEEKFDDTIYFRKIFAYYEQCPPARAKDFTLDLRAWILIRSLADEYTAPNNLYMPAPEFAECFDAVINDDKNTSDKGKFLDRDFYLNLVGSDKENLLREFFKGLGVTEDIDDLKSSIKLRTLDGKYFAPNNFYMPAPELIEYFSAVEAAKNSSGGNCLFDFFESRFLDRDFYLGLVADKNSALEFFKRLGIAYKLGYLSMKIHDRRLAMKFNLPVRRSTSAVTWKEAIIPGCVTILDFLGKHKASKLSFVLWKCLLVVNETVGKLKDNLSDGHCDYYYYAPKKDSYPSTTVKYLRETAWLDDNDGNFKKPADITELADGYGDTTSDNALEVLDFLGISLKVNLTPQQRQLLDLGEKWRAALDKGIDVEKLIDRELQKNITNPPPPPTSLPKSIVRQKNISPIIFSEEESDVDDFTPAAVDYKKKLERAKAESEVEKEKLEQLDALQQKVLANKKYSFGWCKAILDLEILNSLENNSVGKEISVSFGRVKFDAGTQRTLILEHPNRYIPQFVEELENIPLILHTAKDDTITADIEVAGVRNNTLSVKLKDPSKIGGINLNEVVEASISAKNPVFLLEELKTQFDALNLPDDYDMQENLCRNIDFVFGPPGTGKTWNLAEKIIKLMNAPDDKKILVMTPTNKAADVIVNKIIERDRNKSYRDWLLRFGTTKDEAVEKSSVFQDKTFDINSKRKNVTVTTIARFPYDYFMPAAERIFLREIFWNYIIIDEASMIMLAQILLPLYKKTPKKFIIAGDPFQIEPVTAIDFWKNENIYTLVKLKDFAATQTVHDYPVELLTTQYRSVPAVGKIFSRLTYKGILQHARADKDRRPLNIDAWFKADALNIIKFPVKKYESIYRSRRLNGTSSYQIYSALFTFEFVRKLSSLLEKNNPAEKFSVGIISPYRAQADVIEKLFAARKSFERVDIQVGTVHTFQGDECDILFSVFNTPPTISSAPEMFLNRLNIINTAISRARDYLFIVMPDDDTDGIENLTLIKKVKNLFDDEGYFEFAAQDIEKQMFGEENYLEKNSFATGHQNVNVYALPERRYEIRSEETAVDVQLHEN